jgi:hypothetical protein
MTELALHHLDTDPSSLGRRLATITDNNLFLKRHSVMMWFMRWNAWFGISLIAGSFVLRQFVGANMIIDGWAEIQAINGHGLAGIAVPTSVNCDPPSSPCTWDGNFTSDDGTLHLSSVTPVRRRLGGRQTHRRSLRGT